MSLWIPSAGPYDSFLQQRQLVDHGADRVVRAIEGAADGVSSDLRSQTRALVASNAELSQSFGELMDRQTGEICWGIDQVRGSVEGLRDDVADVAQTLRSHTALLSDINCNLVGIVAALDRIGGQQEEIIQQLDRIGTALENPIAIRAREYFRMGIERVRRGLLDKAVESFREAIALNDTDFLSHYHVGRLFLSGVSAQCSVLDVTKAREHLSLAARFALAELKVHNGMKEMVGEVCHRASVAFYASLGSATTSERNEWIGQGLRLDAHAARLAPARGDVRYHQARVLLEGGSVDAALAALRSAVELDVDFGLKCVDDRAFDAVDAGRTAVLESLRAEWTRAAVEGARDLRARAASCPKLGGVELPAELIPRATLDSAMLQFGAEGNDHIRFVAYMEAMPHIRGRVEDEWGEHKEWGYLQAYRSHLAFTTDTREAYRREWAALENLAGPEGLDLMSMLSSYLDSIEGAHEQFPAGGTPTRDALAGSVVAGSPMMVWCADGRILEHFASQIEAQVSKQTLFGGYRAWCLAAESRLHLDTPTLAYRAWCENSPWANGPYCAGVWMETIGARLVKLGASKAEVANILPPATLGTPVDRVRQALAGFNEFVLGRQRLARARARADSNEEMRQAAAARAPTNPVTVAPVSSSGSWFVLGSAAVGVFLGCVGAIGAGFVGDETIRGHDLEIFLGSACCLFPTIAIGTVIAALGLRSVTRLRNSVTA